MNYKELSVAQVIETEPQQLLKLAGQLNWTWQDPD